MHKDFLCPDNKKVKEVIESWFELEKWSGVSMKNSKVDGQIFELS